MMNTILDFDINAPIDILLDSENVEIKFFLPGKFSNITVEHEEQVIIKKVTPNSYYLGKKKKEQSKKMILFLPQDYNNKIYVTAYNNATIKNETTASSISLRCQNLYIEHSNLPNAKCEATGEKTVISNSKLHTLASISDELFVSFSNIDFLCYYHIAGSKQNHDHVPFPIRLIDCNFDKIVISTPSQIYISGGKFSQFISDELARLILFKEVECGNISIKKGDVHFSDCNFIINNEMNIENASSKITITNSYNKNLKLRKPLFQKEYHIINKKEKIYTIKGKNKVKVLKI